MLNRIQTFNGNESLFKQFETKKHICFLAFDVVIILLLVECWPYGDRKTEYAATELRQQIHRIQIPIKTFKCMTETLANNSLNEPAS